MKRSFACVLFLLFVCLAALAQSAAPQPKPVKQLYVRCGRLIVDAEKPALTNVFVIITDGRITSVGKDLPVPAGADIVDYSRYTVLPGLIDAHIHLWTGPRNEHPSAALAALRAQKAMQYALSQGVVAVRVVGSGDFIDVALSRAGDEGTLVLPHIVPGAHAITVPGGHGDFLTEPPEMPLEDYYTPMNGFVNSPAEAEKAVHLQLKYGARVIKVLASGGVVSPLDYPTAEQLSAEELRAVVEQAHMNNVKVAAHAENIHSIMAALQAGVDSIEHGSDMNQQALDFMKAHHVYLVPTLYIVEHSLKMGEQEHLPEYWMRKARALAKIHFPSFDMSLKAGVTMAAGSDQSYEPGHGTVLDEVVTLVEHGMTAQQALTAATKHNSDLLGLPDLATVSEGKEGDLVAVDGDPLSDIHVIKNVKGVVFKGKVVPAP
ncbi:MAG TPA: amidohydrolase family protein [Candidatus Angelobacter sp.]